MNFDLDSDQKAIREAACELLAGRTDGDRLWAELRELGWPGIGIAGEHGGQGLGLVEVAILAEQLGYACAPSPLLGTLVAATALEACEERETAARLLPGLADGSAPGALALLDAPSLVPDAAPDRLLVLASRGEGRLGLFARDGVSAVEAIDPARAHGQVEADMEAAESLGIGADVALDRCAVIVAAELIGLCRRALELTVEYVKERRQFGVPVGSFQAVQHVAAQMLRDTEAATVATHHAAWVADHESAGLSQAAAIAKSSASAAGRSVTAAAIQLHGGIGFTWEADLHWLYKRAQVDSIYLGGTAYHRTRLARAVAAGGTDARA